MSKGLHFIVYHKIVHIIIIINEIIMFIIMRATTARTSYINSIRYDLQLFCEVLCYESFSSEAILLVTEMRNVVAIAVDTQIPHCSKLNPQFLRIFKADQECDGVFIVSCFADDLISQHVNYLKMNKQSAMKIRQSCSISALNTFHHRAHLTRTPCGCTKYSIVFS